MVVDGGDAAGSCNAGWHANGDPLGSLVHTQPCHRSVNDSGSRGDHLRGPASPVVSFPDAAPAALADCRWPERRARSAGAVKIPNPATVVRTNVLPLRRAADNHPAADSQPCRLCRGCSPLIALVPAEAAQTGSIRAGNEKPRSATGGAFLSRKATSAPSNSLWCRLHFLPSNCRLHCRPQTAPS
jgi:hypothetical protein